MWNCLLETGGLESCRDQDEVAAVSGQISTDTEMHADAFYKDLLACDKTQAVPLHTQLFMNVSLAIKAHHLSPGQLMPSSRELARILGISRRTVVRSYEDLLSQGYLKSVEGIGTFVNENTRLEQDVEKTDAAQNELRLSDYAKRLMSIEPTILASQHIPEINYGAPPPDLLPTKQWRQIMLRHCREHDPSALDYDSEPFGYRPLREAIASFLARFRGMRCSSDQVMVFVDSIYPLALVARLLVNEGDLVAMEEPGYPYARLSFSVLGGKVMPVSVDDQGLKVEELTASEKQFRFVYVVPSHQDPLGGTLSLSRRQALVDWAARTGVVVLEDDWEYEYSYGGALLPSLQALDSSGSVVYFSKFYKVLFPLSNVGFIVIPKRLIPVFERAKLLLQSDVSTRLSLQDHYGLTAFINEGALERHIRKTQFVYTSRRQAFITAFSKYLRDFATISSVSGAMHFVIHFKKDDLGEKQILACAAEAHVPVVSTKPYYLGAAPDGEFLIPFAQLNANLMDSRFEKFARQLAMARK